MSWNRGRQQGEQCGFKIFLAAAAKSTAHRVANSRHVEHACDRRAAPWAFLANQQWFALAKVVGYDWGGRAARPGSPDAAMCEECLDDGCARWKGGYMHTLSLEAGSGGWPLEEVCFFSRRLRKRWTPLMSCRGVASLAVSLLLHAGAGRSFYGQAGAVCSIKVGRLWPESTAPGSEGELSGCASARQLNRRLLTAVR